MQRCARLVRGKPQGGARTRSASAQSAEVSGYLTVDLQGDRRVVAVQRDGRGRNGARGMTELLEGRR